MLTNEEIDLIDDPTFMSIGGDQWVSSNSGDIIPNGVLFKLLQACDAPVVIVDNVYRPTMELFIEIRTHRLFGE